MQKPPCQPVWICCLPGVGKLNPHLVWYRGLADQALWIPRIIGFLNLEFQKCKIGTLGVVKAPPVEA